MQYMPALDTSPSRGSDPFTVGNFVITGSEIRAADPVNGVIKFVPGTSNSIEIGNVAIANNDIWNFADGYDLTIRTTGLGNILVAEFAVNHDISSFVNFVNGEKTATFGGDNGARTITDLTNKKFNLFGFNYDFSANEVTMLSGSSTSTANILNIGGGDSDGQALTELNIYSSSSKTNGAGTQVGKWDNDGLRVVNKKLGVGLGASDNIGAGLDIWDANIALKIGGNSGTSRDNNTNKNARFGIASYNNSEEPVGIFYAASTNSASYVRWGGGSSLLNSVMTHSWYTASGPTTQSGTERMKLEDAGLSVYQKIGVGLSSSDSIGATLDIWNGGYPSILIGGDLNANTRTNSTSKYAAIAGVHQTNSEAPILMMRMSATSSNRLDLGGGNSNFNSATQISFYTASTNATLSGTHRAKFDAAGRFGIGCASTDALAGTLDVWDADTAVLIGGSSGNLRANTTQKKGRIALCHYNNSEESIALVHAVSDSSTSYLTLGGGAGGFNSVMEHRFFCASNTTTTTGTSIAKMTTTGLGVGLSHTDTVSGLIDLWDGSHTALVFGADNNARTRTNGTAKVGVWSFPHNSASEENICALYAFCNSGSSMVRIGGSSTALNAVTQFEVYCAANTATLTGSRMLAINTGGTYIIDGYLRRRTTTGITASTTQTQGQGQLSAEVNQVNTVANTNDTCTMPAADTGLQVTVINSGANTMRLYPSSGDNFQGSATNASTTIAAGSSKTFIAYNSIEWITV